MAGESLPALLASLTGVAGESAAVIYAKWAFGVAYVMQQDDSLDRLLRKKLHANAKDSQIWADYPTNTVPRETVEAILAKGGAVGTSVEEMLLKTGLTGWS